MRIFGEAHVLNPKVGSEHSDIHTRTRRQPTKAENPAAERYHDAVGGRTDVWLSEKTGISTSTLSGYRKSGIANVENAVRIAAALDMSIDQLLTGREPKRATHLVAADEADWVTVAEHDLRELTDEGKGEGRNLSPFRRDWLNSTLGVASGLWLTRLLSDYPAADLVEGVLVFCTDVAAPDLLEGQLCLWRVNGGLVIARHTFLAPGQSTGRRPDEVVVRRSEIGQDEGDYVPVARILGRLIGRV